MKTLLCHDSSKTMSSDCCHSVQVRKVLIMKKQRIRIQSSRTPVVRVQESRKWSHAGMGNHLGSYFFDSQQCWNYRRAMEFSSTNPSFLLLLSGTWTVLLYTWFALWLPLCIDEVAICKTIPLIMGCVYRGSRSCAGIKCVRSYILYSDLFIIHIFPSMFLD